jgi:nitroreductase
MDVFEAIQKRSSIRAYKSTSIPKKKLEKILESARLAPSAGNIQPWHFILVTNSEKRKMLASGRYANFLAEAPVVIVGCGDQKASPMWYVVDVTIALEHMVLTATSEGLGTCWVGSFDEKQVKELLKIPENYRVVALIALGYPRERSGAQRRSVQSVRRRKQLEKIVSFEEFVSID